MSLAFRIALRFLLSSKKQTLLIILGISIGVAVQVFIGSLIQGLQESLVDSTVGNSSQVTIKPSKNKDSIDNWNAIISKIENEETLPTEITAISPVAEMPVFVILNSSQNSLLRGFNFKLADRIYDFSKNLSGKFPENEGEILVGKEFSEENKIAINDSVLLVNSSNEEKEFKVSGIFDLNVANLNKSWLITNLETVQKYSNLNNSVSKIELQIKDVFLADEFASDIAEKINSSLEITNWKDQNKQLLSGLQGQDISSLMIQVFVLVAVALGISSILAITVVQRSRQIGILKAMGLKDASASLIFLFQGLILGIFGAIFGILFGLGLSYSFTKFAVNPDGTPVVKLLINPSFIAISGIIAIVVAIIAAVSPARKSSKLSPVEVIRNG
ncbi:MAG: ABC transporter permease [Kosmotoga sp.]|nr:MAG: ABC transporter permease [Kosmotoga sp.]